MDKIETIINNEYLCWHCLKENNKTKTIHIGALGYGSSFDNLSTQIQLCPDCLSKTNENWWKLKVCGNHDKYGQYDQNGEWYEFEEEILSYVRSLPIQGQELFFNTYSYGACADYNMDSQDWIDMQLDIMPDEKYKEYGFYSPSDRKCYHENFPTCQHPVNKIYSDCSSGCWCPFGAHGEYNQVCDKYNISDKCNGCNYYKSRTTPIREIADYDYDDYKIYYIAKLREKELVNKFGVIEI